MRRYRHPWQQTHRIRPHHRTRSGWRIGAPPLLALCLLGIGSLFPACSRTTAVKGMPVKQMELAHFAGQITKKEVGITDKAEIAKLSEVRENQVFTEINGIPEYRVGPRDVLRIRSHNFRR